MRSTAVTLLFLHYYYTSFATTSTTNLPAEYPIFQPTPPRVGSARHAAPARLESLAKGSAWRRLNVDLKLCGSVDFTTHVITTVSRYAHSVAAADLDGDGNFDVLSATAEDGEIALYENLNGTGHFLEQPRLIHVNQVLSVATADIDGDGDLDLLSTSAHPNVVAWYENLDGTGDFSGPQRVITTQVRYPTAAAAADLDGDGDLDVLSASWVDEKVAWYENLDGAGNFSGPQHVITTEAGNSDQTVVAADLDNDGDLDVLWGAKYLDTNLAWHENLDGAGNFSGPPHVITTEFLGASFFAAADLDGDGDLDVLAAMESVHRALPPVIWFENLDGAGHFSEQYRVIESEMLSSSSVVTAADLDGDSDLDVLSISGDVLWHENLDGAGDFSGRRLVTTNELYGGTSLAVADLDGDGDLDIVSALNNDGKIAWHENLCWPPEPTPEPTYWGPQVFGKPQTAGFQVFCVAWCGIFSVMSVVVLGYVTHASQCKDKNLARIILTIVLSHYDYGSDTLFIGFHNFVTPALFVAAIITYFLPLAVFIVVYRPIIIAHLARIYTSLKAKTIGRFHSPDDLAVLLFEIGRVLPFAIAFAASTIVYIICLSVFVSCKLMSISFFAVKFFEAGGSECTQEAFEVMFKRGILSELVFESSGELIIVLLDYSLRAHQDFRSNTDFSSWAVLSIVGSGLMLAIEVWPYLYHIVWLRLGLDAGIAAISTKINFTPDKALAPKFVDRLLHFAGLYAVDVHTLNDSHRHHSEVQIQVCNVAVIELAEVER